MSIVKIDLKRFIVDKRITVPQLAEAIDMPYISVYHMVRRGSAKASTIGKIEAKFGPVENYVERVEAA